MRPNLIIHGGAWYWQDAFDSAKHSGLRNVMTTSYSLFKYGGSALDVVESAVRMLESLPMFDAGVGGYLNQKGIVELDALIADGQHLNFGAVAGVTRTMNPVSLARRIMEDSEQCFMIGQGADEYAEKYGLQVVDNSMFHTPPMVSRYEDYLEATDHDTVGAVAIDQNGNVAVATSTSGSPVKPQGRVGDSPLYGSGGYADNAMGAAGATGKGEHIMRLLLSKHACDLMASGTQAATAARRSIDFADSRFADSMCGILTVDTQGNVSAWHSTPKMAIGWIDSDGNVRTAMNALEIQEQRI